MPMNDPAPRTHFTDRFADDTNFYRYLTEYSVDVVTIIDDDGLIAYQSLSIERVRRADFIFESAPART